MDIGIYFLHFRFPLFLSIRTLITNNINKTMLTGINNHKTKYANEIITRPRGKPNIPIISSNNTRKNGRAFNAETI